MRSRFPTTALLAMLMMTQPALGDTNPEGHGPAGVMAEHMHEAGEFMVGYRHLYSEYSGLYRGSRSATAAELADAGYSMMTTGMRMDMLMLEVMYAPTDRVTLMLMPMYMRMEMDMAPTGGMGHGDMAGGGHSHSVSGLGDTSLSALIRLNDNDSSQWIATLGVMAPTGRVDRRNADGTFVHYGMQSGSGTWDFNPSLTWTGQQGRLSGGSQLSARVPLESRNESGFAFGDRYQLTAWSAWRAAPWLSLSARLAYEHLDAISGHYTGPHRHSSPADLQGNYGGTFVDLGLGFNVVVPEGPLHGLRLGLEWVERVDEDYRGFQPGLDRGLNASLSWSF